MSITSILDPVFNPFMSIIPNPYNLILMSLLLTLVITIVYKYVTNQKLMKELKDDMKSMQDDMKKCKDNPQQMLELQKKVMEKNMKYMLESLKPTLVTMLPMLWIFNWLRIYYTDFGAVLFGLGWIWIYIIFSIIFSIALRKLLKVY